MLKPNTQTAADHLRSLAAELTDLGVQSNLRQRHRGAPPILVVISPSDRRLNETITWDPCGAEGEPTFRFSWGDEVAPGRAADAIKRVVTAEQVGDGIVSR